MVRMSEKAETLKSNRKIKTRNIKKRRTLGKKIAKSDIVVDEWERNNLRSSIKVAVPSEDKERQKIRETKKYRRLESPSNVEVLEIFC